MLTVENPKVYGIMDAIRGMRNPKNSWSRIDSSTSCDSNDGHVIDVKIGDNDRKLICGLTAGGQPHRKFLRAVTVTMDIIAPVYWWAEMDTYKVGTTRDSCSLQHKGDSRDFTISDFTLDSTNFPPDNNITEDDRCEAFNDYLAIEEIVNKWRRKYVDGGKTNYSYFRIMRQLMPMGYNYRATWTANYETLLNIYYWRKNHKLYEWHQFCDKIEKLPMMRMLLKLDDKTEENS